MSERPPEHPGALQRRYDAEELETFKHVVRGVVGTLHARKSPLVQPDQLEVTLIRVTAAIIDLADHGVRDPEDLQKFAESTLNEPGHDPMMSGTHPMPPKLH